MSAAHTPGPWLFNSGVVRTADENNITVRRVANVLGIFADPEKHANARLISAAPDMLLALDKLRKGLDLVDPTRPLQYADAMDLMRKCADAAIAQATGGAA